MSGVSWYEAAAFCESIGKQLPTVYHWGQAATVNWPQVIVPQSNFSGKGPVTQARVPPNLPTRIRPSAAHAPPRTSGTSQMTKAVPPATSIRCSFPLAKKAMDLPSGDQNGCLAACRHAGDRRHRHTSTRCQSACRGLDVLPPRGERGAHDLRRVVVRALSQGARESA